MYERVIWMEAGVHEGGWEWWLIVCHGCRCCFFENDKRRGSREETPSLVINLNSDNQTPVWQESAGIRRDEKRMRLDNTDFPHSDFYSFDQLNVGRTDGRLLRTMKHNLFQEPTSMQKPRLHLLYMPNSTYQLTDPNWQTPIIQYSLLGKGKLGKERRKPHFCVSLGTLFFFSPNRQWADDVSPRGSI